LLPDVGSAFMSTPEENNTWDAILWLLILLVLVPIAVFLLYLDFHASPGGTTTVTPTPTTAQAQVATEPAVSAGAEQTGSLAEQKQCADDGKTFANEWLNQNIPTNDNLNTYTYADPEYHFSVKLNTCLAYVGYIAMPKDADLGSSHLNYIYDVYSNAPILESITYRTCNGTDPCTETASKDITGAPALGSSEFFQQKDVLFSQ
jgi:hypothetical protein